MQIKISEKWYKKEMNPPRHIEITIKVNEWSDEFNEFYKEYINLIEKYQDKGE